MIAALSFNAFAHNGAGSGVGTGGLKLVECVVDGKAVTMEINACREAKK